MTHLRAPGAVEPQSGLIVVEPLAPCPWNLQGVMEYAKGLPECCTGAGVGAALLRVLETCQVVVL